jgi:hypothetical protein
MNMSKSCHQKYQNFAGNRNIKLDVTFTELWQDLVDMEVKPV